MGGCRKQAWGGGRGAHRLTGAPGTPSSGFGDFTRWKLVNTVTGALISQTAGLPGGALLPLQLLLLNSAKFGGGHGGVRWGTGQAGFPACSPEPLGCLPWEH